MDVAAHIREVVASLPQEMVDALGGAAFVAMEKPDAPLLTLGVGEDWKGAHLSMEEYGKDTVRTFVYVFTDNIVPLNEETLELVVLHEIAHALGMDEHEVRALGLGPEVLQCH